MKTATVIEAAKASPPLSVGGLTLFGIPLPEWVMMGSAVYTVFLLIDKAPVVIERMCQLWRWVKARIEHEQGN